MGDVDEFGKIERLLGFEPDRVELLRREGDIGVALDRIALDDVGVLDRLAADCLDSGTNYRWRG